MQVTLSASTSYTIVPAQVKTLTGLTIQRMVDIPSEQVVKAFVAEIPQPIILWSGASYTSIGQWTDVDVENRLQQLF